MNLKIEHLAPYLPYGLKVKIISDHNSPIKDLVVVSLSDLVNARWEFKKCKPILRPLSDLTKEIEHNGEKFIPEQKLLDKYYFGLGYRLMNTTGEKLLMLGIKNGQQDVQFAYQDYLKLFEWHFDVFGLIEKGLAIDRNKL